MNAQILYDATVAQSTPYRDCDIGRLKGTSITHAGYRSARAAAFVISLSHTTALATAKQISQSLPERPTVPNARYRNGA